MMKQLKHRIFIKVMTREAASHTDCRYLLAAGYSFGGSDPLKDLHRRPTRFYI